MGRRAARQRMASSASVLLSTMVSSTSLAAWPRASPGLVNNGLSTWCICGNADLERAAGHCPAAASACARASPSPGHAPGRILNGGGVRPWIAAVDSGGLPHAGKRPTVVRNVCHKWRRCASACGPALRSLCRRWRCWARSGGCSRCCVLRPCADGACGVACEGSGGRPGIGGGGVSVRLL